MFKTMIISSSKFIAIIEWGSEYNVKNFADREDFIHRGEGRDGFASYKSRIMFFSFIQKKNLSSSSLTFFYISHIRGKFIFNKLRFN